MKIKVFLPILGCLLAISVSWISKTPENPSKARVNRIMGVGIFIQCRPVRAYDTLYVFKTNKKLESYPGPSTPNTIKGIAPAIDGLVNQAVKSNRKHARKKRKGRKTKRQHIDAIITDDAVTAVAVKWKAESKINDYDHASLQAEFKVPLYIRNEPMQAYTRLYEVKLSNKLNVKFTGYDKLSVMLNTLTNEIKRVADSTQQQPDGFITENGYSGWAIVFKK